jgi:heptosyltransferase II
MSLVSSMPAPRRILVRGVNWLGDAVMTTPALQRLRERYPDAAISLLTHEKIADLWRGQPCLDAVLTFAPGESPWSIGRKLRAGSFDAALVLPNSPRSALEVWAAGIPRRVGYGARWRRWFLTEAVPPRPAAVPMRKRSAREIRRLVQRASQGGALRVISAAASPGAGPHQVYHYLHLAAALGASAEPIVPTLQVKQEEVETASARWLGATSGIGCPRILLGLNPSAAYGDAKRWPADNFAAVARQVAEKEGRVGWVAFGGGEDHGLCERVRGHAGDVPMVNLAGQTSLRELMALLKSCRVLVTNDSGPMHVAAALGTPVVVPFGSTSPALTGPGLPGDPRHAVLRSNAPCSPCFRRSCPIDFRCMHGIEVDQVARAVLAALQR